MSAPELTIQDVINRGWVPCCKPECGQTLRVAKDGTVEKCPCGGWEYWNLFIQLD